MAYHYSGCLGYARKVIPVVLPAPIDIFTEGMYTLDQAARIARATPQLLRGWFDGANDREPALIRRMPPTPARILSFVDLIQALAIRAIRKERRVSLQKIREAINGAKNLGIEYPFAHKHETYLFGDEVVLRVNELLIQVTGRHKQQELIRPVVELYLEDLAFDSETGLACEYTPMQDGDRSIVVSPLISYGSPIVRPCGYTVASLISAFEGEGSVAGAAAAFGIDEGEVKLALRYDDFLSGIAA